MKLWKTNIQDFKYYLQVEKSLSENSVVSYESDIHKLMAFIELFHPSKKPSDVTLQNLQEFLKYISEFHFTETTQSRIISGIKHFFKFLIFDYNRPKLVLEKFNLVFTEGVKVHEYNSFPSGHSSAAFAMALALAFWFNNKAVSIVVILMAIGVGLSRIYLQQHFIEDVIGGATIGLLAAGLAAGLTWIPKNKA